MEKKIPEPCNRRSSGNTAVTIVIYAVIILLAASASFLGPDYPAHVPVTIGISAFDSADAAHVLEALAGHVREKGGGDIRWIYFGESRTPSGCDFYLLTPIQAYPYITGGRMKLSFLVCERHERCYARGVVITRPGTTTEEIREGNLIFSARTSPAGFLSPFFALFQEGLVSGSSRERFHFPDCGKSDESVVFGVLAGDYAAGGISLESFRSLESRGLFKEGDLEVRYRGMPVAEVVLAADIGVESWKYKGFTERLPGIVSSAPPLLMHDLESLGIGNFMRPGSRTPDPLGNFPDSLLLKMIDHLP
ncbi:MAG: phosphate/phosphite/phosphonate ABC transporter substrate-binding protein [Candidatus Krumholzibacteria bacterium]|jgi:hypothetical protein|nr:phosphate/phosphite/phosphonate ABC transporter substrate-binding protein [Candidatus Krumholzibacteria bacterium]